MAAGGAGVLNREMGVAAGKGGGAEAGVAFARNGMTVAGMKRRAAALPKITATPPGPGRAALVFVALGVPARWGLVRLVGQHRALTLKEAARLAGLSKQAASQHFQILWDAGLVSREAPADDGRARVFRLTETGEGLVQAGLLLE